MTTPLGVPNLPVGALTVETLGEILQDMSSAAMRQRAGERFPDIFNLTTGGDVLDDLTPFGILSAIWAAFNAAVATADPDDIMGPNDLPPLMLNFVEELPIVGILVKLLEALGLDPESADTFLKPIFEFLDWLWTLVGQEAETILKPIFEFLNWLFTEYGDDVETFLQPIAGFLKWLLDFIIARIDLTPFQNLVEELVDALGGFLSAQQFVDLMKTVLQFFFGLFTTADGFKASVTDFIDKLPLIGPIVAAITGKTELDGVALDLGTLSAYFRNLDKQVTDGVASLAAAAQKLLGGIIPVGQISDSTVNLLSQGDFLTSSTVDPANGWSWDGTRTRTGTGGSLKVDCTGSEQRIYCLQDIRVAAGDRLNLNGYVGTNNFTSGSMRLSIQPWGLEGSPAVMTAKTVVNGTARTTAANTFQALPELTYTVPAGVTSIQVSLVVNCNSTCDVFFDDIRLTKTGVLPQALVTNLLDAIQGILNGAGYVAGQGWQFLETAIGFVTGTANDALDGNESTNLVLFENPAGGETVVLGALPVPDLADQLGTAGSGGKMWKASGTANLAAGPGAQAFAGFYDNGTSTSDISYSTANGTFTVTHAGFYEVEVGFTVNASPGMSGAFNVAPAVGVNGPLNKIGSTAFGSYGFGLGGYARTAHSTFIVQLPANGTVTAAYYNYFETGITNFFQGGATNTYFSIAMLNRSQEG